MATKKKVSLKKAQKIVTGKLVEKLSQRTLGETRVRIDFNVTANGNVDLIKKHTAELINICEILKAINPSPEKSRAFSIAQTEFESAAHWAVKGATF